MESVFVVVIYIYIFFPIYSDAKKNLKYMSKLSSFVTKWESLVVNVTGSCGSPDGQL